MKKVLLILLLICTIIFTQTTILAASSSTQLNKGAKYYSEQKYSQAIKAYEKAVKAEPANTQARAGIAQSYIARGNEFFKIQEWGIAANDYRSALFYLNYYTPNLESPEISGLKNESDKKLNNCYKKLHFKKNSLSRYHIAQILDIAGVYTAAGYEYAEAAKDSVHKDKCMKRVNEITKSLSK